MVFTKKLSHSDANRELVLYGEKTVQLTDSLYKNKFMFLRISAYCLGWDPIHRKLMIAKNCLKCKIWTCFAYFYLGLVSPITILMTLMSRTLPLANKVLAMAVLPTVSMLSGILFITETHLEEIVAGFDRMKMILRKLGNI